MNKEKAVKPSHYDTNQHDLIESWHQRFTKDEFRAIMKSHVDKYVFRYDKKNGIEDLRKAQEFLRRLMDYEIKECGGSDR